MIFLINKEFNLNDLVVMKKPHACQTNLFRVVRNGVDVKIKCEKCGREIMLDRVEFMKKLKKVVGESNEKS